MACWNLTIAGHTREFGFGVLGFRVWGLGFRGSVFWSWARKPCTLNHQPQTLKLRNRTIKGEPIFRAPWVWGLGFRV